ncbi:MAG: DUF402 domain-containing protein [Chloroflexi bacterium]|nr:DUF402 domain-containing protein [Chloroflexota bacterium]
MVTIDNSSEVPGFQPGDHIAIRDVFRGRVQTVFPSIVVTDTPELIATWTPLGTTVMNGVSGGTGHLSVEAMAAQSWEMVARKWHTSGVLRLKSPRTMWSLLVFWDKGMTELRGWYINIDAPYRRTRFGFDTWDMFLDIVVEPDRKTWRYKDEDEFANAISAGLFTGREADEVRATAAEALAIVRADRPPFNSIWARWRPDELWKTPELPEGWEEV